MRSKKIVLLQKSPISKVGQEDLARLQEEGQISFSTRVRKCMSIPMIGTHHPFTTSPHQTPQYRTQTIALLFATKYHHTASVPELDSINTSLRSQHSSHRKDRHIRRNSAPSTDRSGLSSTYQRSERPSNQEERRGEQGPAAPARVEASETLQIHHLGVVGEEVHLLSQTISKDQIIEHSEQAVCSFSGRAGGR
jgi:hypothetical protein